MSSADETRAPDPTTQATLRNLSSVQPAPGLPEQIGHYKIKRLLGSGGMGAVYLAVQEQPRRTVALKVMKAEIASRGALRRFEYESQLLARLRHPGIAQIFEAGTHETPTGPVPFFAMEYVSGARTLCDFAQANRLGVRERLELFTLVCDAVHHGHQKGIIHRDLKPANILVDASGQPKIIDYGVARGADADMAVATLQTNVGQLVGTLQYMSPEQCAGDPHNVDVRSDVYALGVVLYELLAGKPPYDLTASPVPEATRIVCEQAPDRLSAVDVQFRGDVETIVSKALEKDRAHRYQSASDLAEDIRRFLRDEPILARPVGPLGRAVKWVRRHREVSAVGAVAIVLLLSVSTYLIVQVVVARDRAERNLSAAHQLIGLMRSTLEFKTPEGRSRIQDGKVDVVKLLDDADENVRRNPPELPGVEAEFREILGMGYQELLQWAKAKDQFERSMALRKAHFPDPSPELAAGLHVMGIAAFVERDYDRARDFYAQELAMRRRLRPGDDRETAMCLTHLAQIELRRRNLAEAERLYLEALDMRKRLFGPDNPDVAAALNNLASLYLARGDLSKAEPMFRSALAMIIKHNGPKDQGVYFTSMNLGRCALGLDRPAEAAGHFRRAEESIAAVFGDRHGRVGNARVERARATLALGPEHAGEAEALAQSALDIFREVYAASSTDDPDVVNALRQLAAARIAQSRPRDALPALREALAVSSRLKPPPQPADLADTKARLGACLAALGQFDEAEPLLVDGCAVLREVRGATDRRTVEVIRAIVDLYRATGREQKAVEYESMLPVSARGPAPT
jgi:tetratricopeptide (TPR) repeat protein